MLQRLIAILHRGDTEPTEIGIGLTTLLYGAWLAIPTWRTFESMTSFWKFEQAGIDETALGIVIAVIGAAKIFAALTWVPQRRRWAGLLVGTVWSGTAWVGFSGNPPSVVGVWAVSLFLATLWVNLRHSGVIR